MNSTEAILKLQNGSDVRGIAVEGVPDEKVNLTPEAVNRIAAGFAKFLAQKLGKRKGTYASPSVTTRAFQPI